MKQKRASTNEAYVQQVDCFLTQYDNASISCFFCIMGYIANIYKSKRFMWWKI